ncbi:MAG: IPT/TIG domain-containing protein [Patescibacteria group bacterium]
MKFTYIKTIFTVCALALTLVAVQPVSAQAVGAALCAPFNYNMSFGGRGGDVARMQGYLITQGYLANGSATGYYGSMTYAAVRRFQIAHGISPTGSMGPVTRVALFNAVCGNTQVPPVITNPTYAPTISQLSPSYGPFGTVVTIYGQNFNRAGNNSINFAGVNNIAINRVSNDGTSLQFTIPASPCPQGNYVCTMIALAPGQYPISVTTPQGTSNSLIFNATDYNNNNNNNTNRAPVINSVEGSTVLTVGQAGAWAVRATDPSSAYGNGSLTYAVTWGDESQYNTASLAAGSFVQSATFNHTYSNPGTYTVTFTVRNSYGLETRSTITVLVTGYSTSQTPVVTQLNPSSGPFGTTVTITGRNFSRTDNVVNFAGVNRAYVGIPSYDGTTLQFTPTATPCTNGGFCSQSVLNPGDYTVSVSNQSGTSNLLSYKVTSGGNGGGNLPQSQVLSIGQSFTIGDLTFVPVSVIEDSRCGVDVTCIQAGRVAVQTAIRAGYTYNYVNLSTTDVSPFTTDSGYKIQIINVTPVKYAGQTISSSQYRITYMISR